MTSNILPDDRDKLSDRRDYSNNSRGTADFSLSEKAKALGIRRLSREDNTIVVEVKIDENNVDDILVTRIAIIFNDWNKFLRTIKSNILSNLKFEVERKQLNRIIATVETVVNQNYGTMKTPIDRPSTNKPNHTGANEQGEDNDITGADSADNTFNNDKSNESIPFLTINQLVKMQRGTFN